MHPVISRTMPGTRSYPLHQHNECEIMYYVKGCGYLRTEDKSYPFSPGTVIIVPKQVMHGSASENEFENICICGDFDGYFNLCAPLVRRDGTEGDAAILAELIYKNRLDFSEYLYGLCNAYVSYLLGKMQTDNRLDGCIKEIILAFSEKLSDSDLRVKEILEKSGYAIGYIRKHFKKKMGKTPTAYLSEMRIRHACRLIDIYKDTLPISTVAEMCGFLDYVYFSKQFKAITGRAPKEYKKQ